eukprot:1471273-Pleurochrysis_carterae.AAC.1
MVFMEKGESERVWKAELFDLHAGLTQHGNNGLRATACFHSRLAHDALCAVALRTCFSHVLAASPLPWW